jgi:glycosyltransferase involved in cell wall biosynthesis
MKIIALVPIKNESTYLPAYLSSIKGVADIVIALDDFSTDNSIEILKDAGAIVLPSPFSPDEPVNMGGKRNYLLQIGRKMGGTHFIWLDADEIFSANFKSHSRKIISLLDCGQKLSMRWVHLWKNYNQYLDDKKSAYGHLWKDFIVHDDPSYFFDDKFLSEGRTQGPSNNTMRLPETDGVVLHYQFANWGKVQIKQAWYRCVELIKNDRSARRINITYAPTLDGINYKTKPLKEEWEISTSITDEALDIKQTWHYAEITIFFDKYGIEFFEPLQIWHISELKTEFIKRIGREPKPRVFHPILVFLNNIKNNIRNSLHI